MIASEAGLSGVHGQHGIGEKQTADWLLVRLALQAQRSCQASTGVCL